MTYPPQPGQPGQPGPYGQQPGPYGGQQPYGQQPGGYPQSGGFPQQGGQYPPSGGFPQQGQFQQDPYGQYGQPGGDPYGGGFGGEPPKKKTGLWVGLAAAAVVIIAFVITAFVAPGFLLSDDENNNAGGDQGSGARAFAEKLVTALKAHDSSALQKMTCPNPEGLVDEVVENPDPVEDAKIDNVTEQGNTATVKVSVTAEGNTVPFTGELAKNNGNWCWQSLATGDGGSDSSETSETETSEPTSETSETSAPDSTGGDGEAVIEDFLAAINSGDSAAAEGLLCSGAESASEEGISKATSGSANFSIQGSPRETDAGGQTIVTASLTGQIDGKDVYGGVSAMDRDGYCIGAFIVT